MPIVFIILVAMFWGAGMFLGNIKTSLESTSEFSLNSAQTAEITALEASSTAFNTLVALAQAAEGGESKTYTLLEMVQSLASADEITINHLAYPGLGAPITLSGSTQSDDRILAFKAALENAPGVSAINLPIAGVQDNGGTYTFQIVFNYAE